jgi:hypothetical protein
MNIQPILTNLLPILWTIPIATFVIVMLIIGIRAHLLTRESVMRKACPAPGGSKVLQFARHDPRGPRRTSVLVSNSQLQIRRQNRPEAAGVSLAGTRRPAARASSGR